MWKGWIIFLAGLWLFASSFIWQFQTPLNLLICGIVVFVFAVWSVKTWQGLMLAFCGAWLIMSGSTFYLARAVHFFLIGFVVAVLGAWLGVTKNRILSKKAEQGAA
jgi:hypothetical protein